MPSDSEQTVRSNEIDEVMRALKNNDPKAEVLKPYLNAGRWISPTINPYANLTSVFFTAMQADAGEEDINQSSEIDQKEELKIFDEIMKLVPSFKNVIIACSEHRRALLNLIKMLQDSSHNARNDDVSKTNACIVDYIVPETEALLYDRDEYPLPGKTDYTERGWNHPQYTILLYPMAIRDHINVEDLAQIIYDIEHGNQTISESEWPAFLYPRGTNPDVEDDLAGLFRGYLLPRVFRQIFTSPSSALRPDMAKKGRPCKARLHHLTEVTGRTIAYVCVITRIALRGLGWTLDDASFEYPVFYQNIVSMFEDDPEDDWVKDTLAWWTEQIPGLPRSTAAGKVKRGKKNITGIEGRIMNPIARAEAQRRQLAAKRAMLHEPILPIPEPNSSSPPRSQAAHGPAISDSEATSAEVSLPVAAAAAHVNHSTVDSAEDSDSLTDLPDLYSESEEHLRVPNRRYIERRAPQKRNANLSPSKNTKKPRVKSSTSRR